VSLGFVRGVETFGSGDRSKLPRVAGHVGFQIEFAEVAGPVPHGRTTVSNRSSSAGSMCRMTDDLTIWLRERLAADSIRLTTLASERAGTGRPDDRVIVRIAMDQVSMIGTQTRIIEIAEQAIVDGIAAQQFEQTLKWMAYQRQGEGYMDTWAPDGVDLVATLRDFEVDEDDD
jgi:hypothetical protein